MKKQLLVASTITFVALGALAPAQEQKEGKAGMAEPKLYCILKEHVKPSMIGEYEAAVTEMIELMRSYGVDSKKIHFRAVQGPEIGYTFVIPLEDWAAMGAMHVNWQTEVIDRIGKERWAALEARFEPAIDHMSMFHVMSRPELSYRPETPDIDHEEMHYFHYGFYYPLPGKQMEFEQLAKNFRELYVRKGLNTGWAIYQSVTGPELPAYAVIQGARSQAEFFARRDKVRETLGEEGKALGDRVMKLVRKYEFADGTPRPDLSFMDMEGETGRKPAKTTPGRGYGRRDR